MPRLSTQNKIAMGINTTELSYDGQILKWPSHPVYSDLVGKPIVGSKNQWLNPWTLVFQSCQTPTNNDVASACRLYSYDIRTATLTQVSASGANQVYAGGGIWAAWLDGSGYRDSLGRTHADYGVVDVDDDGTVVVILDYDQKMGLGYLLPTDATADDVHIITTDVLSDTWSFGGGVVMYHANGLLTKYNIGTKAFDTTNVPVLLTANYGEWVLGWHLQGLDTVAFEFGKTYAHQISTGNQDLYGDIRVATDNTVYVATSYTQNERYSDIRRYTLTQNEPLYDLFSNRTTGTRIVPGIGPTGEVSKIVGSDIVTLGDPAYRNPTGPYSTQGISKIISSKDWFGTHGDYIRGAWQWDLTAVVAQTDATGNTNVTVKNSSANTWVANEAAYGSRAVAIRPASTTTNVAPKWEVTWVQSPGTAYRRAILDANLALVGSVTTTSATFGAEGMLDLYSNGVPIITTAHYEEWYGYVKLRYPTTRGNWTVGKDVSPTCNIDRLVAWNNATSQAYVVWNGKTEDQSRLTLEYDSANTASPVVVPSLQTFVIRYPQFLPLGQIDVEIGKTPGVEQPIAPKVPDINKPGAPPAWPWSFDIPAPIQDTASKANATPDTLKTNTRVFRQYQTIPPTAKVLAAIKSSGSSTSSAKSPNTPGEPPPTTSPI